MGRGKRREYRDIVQHQAKRLLSITYTSGPSILVNEWRKSLFLLYKRSLRVRTVQERGERMVNITHTSTAFKV